MFAGRDRKEPTVPSTLPLRTTALLIALAVTVLATGCDGGSDPVSGAAASPSQSRASTASTRASTASTPADTVLTPSATRPGAARSVGSTGGVSPPKPSVRWANSTQFMQVQSGTIQGGALMLTVRPAKKRELGESFETVSIPGPFLQVTVHEDAVISRLGGKADSQAGFVTALRSRTAHQRGEAFDVTFDDYGRAFEIKWLYVP